MALQIDYREFNIMYPPGGDYLQWRVVDVFGEVHRGRGIYRNNCYGERFEAVVAAAGLSLSDCVRVEWLAKNGFGFIKCAISDREAGHGGT